MKACLRSEMLHEYTTPAPFWRAAKKEKNAQVRGSTPIGVFVSMRADKNMFENSTQLG